MSLERKILVTRDWFERAQAAIISAEHLRKDDRLVNETFAHCQQSIEKTLKGFRFWHGLSFIRTHDLNILSQDCIAIEKVLEPLLKRATPLTHYAGDLRYPDSPMPPPLTSDDRDEMITLAKDCLDLILSKLPKEVRP